MPATREGTLQRPRVAIRDFEPEDYRALVEIENLVYPENPTTVEEERFEDARFDRGKMFHRRLVAVDPATKSVVGVVPPGSVRGLGRGPPGLAAPGRRRGAGG